VNVRQALNSYPYVLQMRAFLVGNSLVRSLTFSRGDFEEVICLPGADLDRLFEETMATPYISDCLVYLVEGPIRYCRKVGDGARREYIYTEKGSILPQLQSLRRRAQRKNITLVFPTMSLLHFGKYNYHRGRHTHANHLYTQSPSGKRSLCVALGCRMG